MSASQLGMAEHYLEIGRPEQALEALDRAGGELLDDEHAWGIRGWALLQLEAYGEAAGVARDAIGRFPDEPELLALLAEAEAELDRLAEAETAILGALRLRPDDPTLLTRYARILMRGAQVDKAARVLDLAERQDPDDLDVMRSRTLLAHLRGRRREVRRSAEQLLAQEPNDPVGLSMLGAQDIEQSRPGRALDRFGSVVRDDPANRHAAQAARTARAMRAPQYLPVLFFSRFGAGPTWVGAIVLIFGLRAAGLDTAAGIATIAWLGICVWSWIAAPMLERRIERETR